jgi:CDP-paratose 2-epimerase
MSGTSRNGSPAHGGSPEARRPLVGLLEWFRPGEHERVERAIDDMRALGIRHLRTGVSWADCHTEAGIEWYDWLLPRLAVEAEILPCFLYTPPSLARAPKPSAPPRRAKDFPDFLDQFVNRHGRRFDWVELWNEPNNLREWDWTLDPEWRIFSEMIGAAAYWMRQQGKKTVLGGMSPVDTNWLALMGERGVLEYINAVGIHGFPGIFEYSWEGWEEHVRRVRQVLRDFGSPAEVWITEAGYSTWRQDDWQQVRSFLDAVAAPADRLYWYAAHDLRPDLPTVDGFHSDERDYHFGLKRADGSPKLLYRLWVGEGVEGVRAMRRVVEPDRSSGPRRDQDGGKTPPVLITGGAGFVGTNLAHRLLQDGRRVRIYDSLARPGVEDNLRWLHRMHGDHLEVRVADVRNPYALREAVQGAAEVFHFAAQVAVTTSLEDPITDFEVNLGGTVNLLEAIRSCPHPPPLLFTSTNKVYGALEDLALDEGPQRYDPASPEVRARGIGDSRPLDFHSPYGCSKGAADQYVLDYARSFGLPALVFRMSCIYGPRQFGTEDQGWVAHFLIRALRGQPITLYGDGKQVRDILFVDDLVEAFLRASANLRRLSGRAFNIGGGPANAISLRELLDLIGRLARETVEVSYADWRTGDQRYYVSDTSSFEVATGWRPRTSVQQGVAALRDWLLTADEVPAVPDLDGLPAVLTAEAGR